MPSDSTQNKAITDFFLGKEKKEGEQEIRQTNSWTMFIDVNTSRWSTTSD